ncbi:MAG: 50S ribosomal protein L29 [Bacteroidota bacterium]
MKAAEIRNLSVAELQEKIAAEQVALTKLRTTQVVSELSNTAQINQKRKVVARLLTDARRRELSETK